MGTADTPDEQNDTSLQRANGGYVLPRANDTVQPGANPAADMIREKLHKLYASEPDAEREEQLAEAATPRSKHQQFMHELNGSGKSLAQIQTEWHTYYIGLPDDEKHIVWQEFYASSATSTNNPLQLPKDAPTPTEKIAVVRSQIAHRTTDHKQARQDRRDAADVQQDIRAHATKKGLTKKQHFQSLLFGLVTGVVALLIVLFSFFNEVFLYKIYQPGRATAETPLIVGAETVAPSQEPQVIIPKINVQIPIRFDVSSTTEATMQKELESGVAHYPTTSNPGENGNGAYFGHSSNNIFNKGAYKFAFVLLHQLVPGDTFYITKDGKLFAYKVFDVKIVEPNQVEVLDPVANHPNTATLITCDPPGTSLRRLVVVGDQVSPDPNANSVASVKNVDTTGSEQLTGNGQTLWGRIVGSTLGKALLGMLVIGAVLLLFRRTNRSNL